MGTPHIVILICILLLISNVEHLFMYMLANCLSSSENVYSNPLPAPPFVFLGPHPQQMEVPRPGVELELELPP